ncbi:hypothetical protein ABLN85_20265, partial [Mycobacterium tuberculosis]
MEYCIAGDDGSAGIWNRPFDVDLDGDGRLDAIGLDLDGDGLRDDALADFDGDDVADHAVFDVDNDGTPESYFIDDGSGTWAVAVDRGGQLRWYGLDGVEHTGGPLVDFDGFGGLDDRLLDTDGDGVKRRTKNAKAFHDKMRNEGSVILFLAKHPNLIDLNEAA